MHDVLRPTVRCPVEQNKLLRILDRQHLEQHGVNQAENRASDSTATAVKPGRFASIRKP